uniref:NACHT domain-containing protein n=1 Tax=Strigamia maritima TaxID=126957 RepID=T1II67_STRMM
MGTICCKTASNNCDDCRAPLLTEEKGASSGNTFLTVERDADHIHIKPYVNKSRRTTTNIININTTPNAVPDPEAICSNLLTRDIRSCCNTTDENNYQPCDIFRKKLQNFYKKLTLPKVAWLERGQDLSLVEHFIQLKLNESENTVTVEEIFNPIEDEKAHRIQIDGQPGFGKTTLATKLAYDWANSEEYINFKFVLLVPLRELQNRSIDDAIDEIGKRCTCNDAVQIIYNHKKSTLLILDGLDEISQQEREEIVKILYRQMYEDATVIVFCRTGLFNLSMIERRKLFGVSNMRDDFQCKQISTLGVANDEKKQDFLEKILPKSTVNRIMERLSSQWKLFNSPLLLMLLAVIIQEGENIEDFTTNTEFYKKLFNCIFKHSFVKRGRDIDSDFDLFALNSSANPIQESMRQFGKLSAQKIFNNDLTFDCNNFTREIYELGFLISHEELTFVNAKTHFEALHLTIIEFAAAFAFWVDLKLNISTVLLQEDLKLVVNHFFKTEGTSKLLPFLAGLMEDELDQLLFQIESFSGWFGLSINRTLNLVAECLSDNVSSSKNLRSFIPSLVDCSKLSGDKLKLKELLVYGSKCGKIEKIVIRDREDIWMVTNEITTLFQLNVSYLTVLGNSQLFSNPIPFNGSLNEVLHFATSTNCTSCILLELSNFSQLTEFCELMRREKTLSRIKLHYLQIKIINLLNLDIVKRNTIIDVLKYNQVQYLDLHLYSETNKLCDISGFLLAAARSKYLTCVKFCNVSIDFFELTNGGKKKFTEINLKHCTLTCKQPLLFKNCCHHLLIDDDKYSEDIKGIFEVEPSTLSCRDESFIDDLRVNSPTWTGFNTVTTACFRLEKHLSSAVAWTNLQTLYLDGFCFTNLSELAKSILTLPIVNLGFYDYLNYSKLFKYMNDMWANNKSHLKRLLLKRHNVYENAPGFDLITDYIRELVEGLARSQWDEIYFFESDINFHNCVDIPLFSTVQLTRANLSFICVEFGISEQCFCKNYDSYFNMVFNPPEVLSITRKCH